MSTSDTESSPTQQSPLASRREAPKGGAPSRAYFPLGYKPAFSQWWASVSPAVAEHTVMSFVPYLQKPPTHTQTGSAPASSGTSTLSLNDEPNSLSMPVRTNSINDPHGPRQWYSNLVKLSGKNRALNEFSVERTGEKVEDTLVMLHGYGAGLGFFYKNFEGLSRVSGWKIYALDMLGMGRSTRPAFRISAKDQAGKIAETESWFIDALEEWRVLKKIDKFTLLGHSMGGYMAVAYALKYPGHLNKLILASPVGIPEDPYATSASMPEPEESTLASEFTQDQEADIVSTSSTPSSRTTGDDNSKFGNKRNKRENTKLKQEPAKRPLPFWLTYLWDANVSPFSLVRWAGPLGPRLVSGWTSRRFSHLPNNENDALHMYAYSLFRQRGSGEYALPYILAPGAFARSPLIRRIHGVGRQPIPPSPQSPSNFGQKEHGYPIILMYGENDWMDIAGGYAAEQACKEEREKVLAKASKEEKELENGSAKVVIVQKAGHHLYLDGWEEFNEFMRGEMKQTTIDGRKMKATLERLGVEVEDRR
ncbi:hypothetical protein DSL72_005053 [Monilinia vaccinii-corymbosi]|uniref:AB hydrolase-1 domain-containing protein n=1 Tax=Monilinia vaccinii-corymbosi TaxID=61207 RepID=A0A8A3PEI6_9HELO|nr:hypothetical protein DSL72_005053 [Monilinia vaccinii-corymbosi]